MMSRVGWLYAIAIDAEGSASPYEMAPYATAMPKRARAVCRVHQLTHAKLSKHSHFNIDHEAAGINLSIGAGTPDLAGMDVSRTARDEVPRNPITTLCGGCGQPVLLRSDNWDEPAYGAEE